MLDFGIAAMQDEAQLTDDGQPGTPGYLSPEAIAGQEVDARADVYALGVMMFEMLTGRAPFASERTRELLRAHRDDPAPDITTQLPELPATVARLVRRCLAKDPRLRPSHAAAFREEMKQLARLGHEDTLTAVEESTRPSVPPVQAPQWPRTAGALAIALVLTGLGIWALLGRAPAAEGLSAPSVDEPATTAAPAEPPPDSEETMPAVASTTRLAPPATSTHARPPVAPRPTARSVVTPSAEPPSRVEEKVKKYLD